MSRRVRWGAAIVGLLLAGIVAGLVWRGRVEQEITRPAGPLVGQSAPRIADGIEFWLNGGEVELAQLKGQVVLLFFWHPLDDGKKSLAALPHVRELADSFASKGLVTIGLCVLDEPKDAEPILREQGIKFRIALDCDADVHQAYQIDKVGTPYGYVVDRAGGIVWGGRPADLTARTLRKLLP